MPMIFLVAILGVRVVAELALPTYTSNIVDKGIQQSGIKDAVPEKISEKSFRELQLFMTDDEIKKVSSKYAKDGDVYKLDTINDKERSELNDILKYIDMLNEVDTSEVKPLVYINEAVNNFREKEEKPSLKIEKVLLNAPESAENAIVVPKVIGE